MKNIEYMPKHYIAISEAGRGLAAFYVFVTHIIKYMGLMQTTQEGTILYYTYHALSAYGHQAVIFFFLLSGFSIHYSSLDRQLNSWGGIVKYYYLRFRRIYPIYLLAIILTLGLLIIGHNYLESHYKNDYDQLSYKLIIYNLLFLADRHYIDGIISSALPTNGPLWSLSYEVLYYLIYPLFWLIYKKYGTTTIIILSCLVSILSILLAKKYGASHLTNVLSLYIVWVLGAVLAYLYRVRWKKLDQRYLIIIVFILFQSVWVLESAVYTLGTFYEILWGLLYFSVMLLFLYHNDINLSIVEKLAGGSVFILSTLFIDFVSTQIELTKHLYYFYIKVHIVMFLFLYLTATSIHNLKGMVRKILMPFENMGKYSYALYIIHYPIIYFTAKILINYNISIVLIILTVPFILIMAKLLETNYQQYMASKLDKIINQ